MYKYLEELSVNINSMQTFLELFWLSCLQYLFNIITYILYYQNNQKFRVRIASLFFYAPLNNKCTYLNNLSLINAQSYEEQQFFFITNVIMILSK